MLTHCPHCGKSLSESPENSALATVAATLPRGLKWLFRIADPKSFRRAFRLGSLQSMGEWIGRYHPNGHKGRAYNRSVVLRYENGDRALTDDVKLSYSAIADALMREHTGGRVGIAISFGRAWKLTPFVVCQCRRLFTPEKITDTQCKRCRNRKATK